MKRAMEKDNLHTLDPFLESKNEQNQDNNISKHQPCNEQREEESDDDIEFQTSQHITNGYTPYSPTLWTQRASGDTRNRDSNLLQHYDYFGRPFPGSRLQVIKDGRRELMEMIQNLPESSFELSLKDIVDDKTIIEECQHAAAIVEGKEKVRMPQQTKTFKRSKISRSESMDSGVFLLKMFLPVSIGNKKKLKQRNCSKVSPKTPFDESEKSMNRDWWKIVFLVVKENKLGRSIKKSMSFNNSSKRRLVKSNSDPCWSSFNSRGCFF